MKKIVVMKKIFLVFLAISLLPMLLSCDKPPKKKIEEDFQSLQKINPLTNLPRPEWEFSKASGFWIKRIYKEDKTYNVEIKLKKPYYKKENIRLYYRKESDGTWKFAGWEFFRP